MSGSVVVDPSLALNWILNEPYTAEARKLLSDWDAPDVRRIAPSWFAAEIANVLYQYVRRGHVTLAGAQLADRGLLAEVGLLGLDPALGERAIRTSG